MSTGRHFVSSVTRSESLSLYREILRTCRAFHWCDPSGRPWNRVLKANARSEFDLARSEVDPLVIARMLVAGRECVQQVQRKFNEADLNVKRRILDDVNRGAGGDPRNERPQR